MSELSTYDCTVCGESFVAHPDANAVDPPTCSPACAARAEAPTA